VLKKTYFYRFPEVSSVAFVFWSFACAALMCGVVVVFSALRGERFHDWLGKSQVFFPCALGIGLGSAGGNIFQVMALRQLDAMVLYPLAQGTIVIALWISACVFYHEPTRTSGFLALALGMVGIVLLGFF
ncbi:MAG: EamA family transporter, partial [Clostridia bacterium]